ncbi:MAG: hypothetical protein AAB383_05165 [Patescibacteria group bacterium]
MADLNPLYDPATDNQAIAPEVQSMLNQAPKSDTWDDQDQVFLNDLLAKVEAGTIQLYSASSLLNNAVYEKLTPELQGKADQNALLMIGKVREIVDLMKLYGEPNTIVKSLVESLFAAKQRAEEAGDIFII